MTWWQSSKTFVVQGEEKYSKKVKLKIQDLLNKSKTNETPTMENSSNDNENTTPKRKLGKGKSKNDDVVTASKDVSKSQDNQIIYEEIQRVWNDINNLNTMLSELTIQWKGASGSK